MAPPLYVAESWSKVVPAPSVRFAPAPVDDRAGVGARVVGEGGLGHGRVADVGDGPTRTVGGVCVVVIKGRTGDRERAGILDAAAVKGGETQGVDQRVVNQEEAVGHDEYVAGGVVNPAA